MKIYHVGEKLFAFGYDSLGYYRGNDDGEAEPVVILDVKRVGTTVLYLTANEKKEWVVYKGYELFRSLEEIEKITNKN